MPLRAHPRGSRVQSNPDAHHEDDSGEAVNKPSAEEASTHDKGTRIDDFMDLDSPETSDMRPSNPEPEARSTTGATAASPPPRPRAKRLVSVLSRGSSRDPINADGESRPATLKFKPKSFLRRSKEEREAEEKAEAERRAARTAAEGTATLNDRGGHYGRGRGRGGGVGDMNKWKDQRFNLSHGASGHLGGSTVQDSSTGRRGRGGYGGGGGGGGGGEHHESANSAGAPSTGPHVKKEPGVKREKGRDGDTTVASSISNSKRKRTKIKEENQPAYVSSEDEFDADGAARVDIEKINLISDDEDTDSEPVPASDNAKGKQRQKISQARYDPLRPVRIQRQEHVERAVGVNTDASSLTSAELRRRAKERNEAGGSLFLPEQEEGGMPQAPKVKGRKRQKDVEFVRDERKWKGVYQDDDDDKDAIVKIKDEPKDGDDDVMILDKPVPINRPKPMAIDEEDAVPLSEALHPPITGVGATAKEIAGIEQSTQKVREDPLEDQDEEYTGSGDYNDLLHRKIATWTHECEKYSNTLDEIHTLLSEIEPTLNPSPATKHDHHDPGPINLESHPSATIFDDTGGNFIFQFPPLLPSLRDSTKKPPQPPAPPSEKPSKPSKPSSEPSKPPPPTNPFATTTPLIKEDPDTKPSPDTLTPQNSIPNTYISGGLYHPTGRSGTLDIHKNGKMKTVWGGLEMDVSKGGDDGVAAMPQEMVMMRFESGVAKVEDEEAEGVEGGKAGFGMGQVRPGCVCVPGLAGLLA